VINPNDALAHQLLAQCLNKLNKSEDAMAEARNALELDPVLAIPHLILALSLLRRTTLNKVRARPERQLNSIHNKQPLI